MHLDELNKNSKYGYRRAGWPDNGSYVYFDVEWVYVSDSHRDTLSNPRNLAANDWYLSYIPNAFYKPTFKDLICS